MTNLTGELVKLKELRLDHVGAFPADEEYQPIALILMGGGGGGGGVFIISVNNMGFFSECIGIIFNGSVVYFVYLELDRWATPFWAEDCLHAVLHEV